MIASEDQVYDVCKSRMKGTSKAIKNETGGKGNHGMNRVIEAASMATP